MRGRKHVSREGPAERGRERDGSWLTLAASLLAGLLPTPGQAGPPTDEPAAAPVGGAGELNIITTALAIDVRAERLDREQTSLDLGAPPIHLELPAGRYRISATGPGYRPWSQEIEIVAGVRLDLQVEPELVEFARLELRPANDDAKAAMVLLDGELLCELPCDEEIEPGNYTLEIRKRRFKGLRFPLEVVQADDVIIDVALEPATPRAPAIVTGAVALTSLAVAIGFTVSADRRRRELVADLDGFVQYDPDDRRIDNGRRDAVIATSLYGVTAAVGLMTLYYLLRQSGPSSRADKQRRSLAGVARPAARWALLPGLLQRGGGVFAVVEF